MSNKWRILHEFVTAPSDSEELWSIINGVWPEATSYDYDFAEQWIDPELTFSNIQDPRNGEFQPMLIESSKRCLPRPSPITSLSNTIFEIHTMPIGISIQTLRSAERLADLHECDPEIRIDYQRGLYSVHDHFTRLRKTSETAPPARDKPDVPISLEAGFIRVSWSDSIEETKRQTARFFRNLKKFATNRLTQVDKETLRPVQRVEKGGRIWVCPQALEWSRAHPLNFIERQWKPIDWDPPQPCA